MEEQHTNYSDEDFGSAGDDECEQDAYEDEEAPGASKDALAAAERGTAPTTDGIAGDAADGETAVDADNLDDRGEAEEYDGEDEFETDEREESQGECESESIRLSTTADNARVADLPVNRGSRGAVDPTATSTKALCEVVSRTGSLVDKDLGGNTHKSLASSRRSSMPATTCAPLASVASPSLRRASVPSIPVAATGRWSNGYEKINDGETFPRAKLTLIPLPVLEEVQSSSMREGTGGDNSGSNSEESDDDSQSEDEAQVRAVARLRSLSLQQRQLAPPVVPVRKAKSYIYLSRLPSVSELVAEDVALLGVPDNLGRYSTASTRGDSDAAPVQAHDGDTPHKSNCAIELPTEADAEGNETVREALSGKSVSDSDSSSSKPPRREVEQLLHEAQALMAESDDPLQASPSCSDAESDDAQDAVFASNTEAGEHDIPDPDVSAEQYGDDEFIGDVEANEADDIEQYAEEGDGFDDDGIDVNDKASDAVPSLHSASMGRSESKDWILFSEELEGENRRETHILLREAQMLLQPQRNDRGVTVNETVGSVQQALSIDQYGEDDHFDDEDGTLDPDDEDLYLADDGNEDDSTRSNPGQHENVNAEVAAHERAHTTHVSGDTSPARSPVAESFVADTSNDNALSRSSCDTSLDQSSHGTAGEILEHQENNSAVHSATPKDDHATDKETTNDNSTAATEDTKETPKRPRPPPAKSELAPKSGRKATNTIPVSSRLVPPQRPMNSTDRSTSLSPMSTLSTSSPLESCESDIKIQNNSVTPPDIAQSAESIPKNTSDSASSPSAPNAREASSPARSNRCSPSKQPRPLLPDEYPELPRKEPVPRQRRIPKKPLSPEVLRELKPVKSPPNLRVDDRIVDKAKRDWLFLNMFRHGNDVSKYEPFVPRSVLPRPPGSGPATKPQSATCSTRRGMSVEQSGVSSPYSFGGRKLLKPQGSTVAEREKDWVEIKPLDCAIPAYDSILDKYCATVTSPVVQRHIYQTRSDDLSPQLAFVLEKRAEKHFKQVVRAAGSPASSYRTHPPGQ